MAEGRAESDRTGIDVEGSSGENGIDGTDPHRAQLNAATQWTGPIGTVAGSTVFAISTASWVSHGRLIIWLGLIVVAVVLMVSGTRHGSRAERAGLIGHGLVGALWGSALLIGLDGGEVDERFLWAVLAVQFATSAGVALGTTIDERKYGPAVLITMWPLASVLILLLGRPVIAIGMVVFLAILLFDLRSTGSVIDELIDMRAAETARAGDARWLAMHDSLTGVSNRIAVDEALGGARAFGAAFFIDLDYFKEINDRLGHHVGDQVLIEVARRIESLFGDGDLVARLGGDEFIALVDADTGVDDSELLQRAASIIAVLERPMTDVAPEHVYISASIGITRLEIGDGLGHVLRQADDAMYEAKRLGRRRAVVFGDRLLRAGAERAELSMAVRRAVRHGEIEAWGQPIFDFETGRIVTVELLARWRRGDAYVSPLVFIPIAERIGMTADLTRAMLNRATSALAAWSQHDLLGAASIAINVSPADLRNRTLVDEIDCLLASGQLDASRLVLEINESSEHADVETMSAMLAPLRAQGVSIALDDFGSGQSSFNGVRHLDVDEVKLHESIIHRLDGDERETKIAGAIARLAEALGCDIVAEGVETDVQIEQLLLLGFRRLQGNAICEPMPMDDLGGDRGRRAVDRLVGRHRVP